MYASSRSIALLILAAAVLAGCGCHATRTGYRTEYIETGRPIKGTLVRGIQKRETTQTQIIEWFGAPASRTATDEDIAYAYRHCKRRISTIGTHAGTHAGNEMCTELFIVFDRASSTVKDFDYAPDRPELAKLSPKGRGTMP